MTEVAEVVGNFTSYAVASVTPERDTNIISVTNPLGVVPKLVHVRTTDRPVTSDESCIYEFVLLPNIGASMYRYNSNDNARQAAPTAETPASSSYRQYRLTANTIEIVRATIGSVWRAGVTYSFNFYA